MFRKKHASQNLAPESPETEQDTDFDTGHFRTLSDFTNCYLCEKKLSKSSMKKNCYRCGMVFCQTCRGYERKLNSRGEPDDLGSLHKVCRKCYTQEQTIGAIREHEKHFKSRRRRISDMKSKDSDEKLKRLEDISKKIKSLSIQQAIKNSFSYEVEKSVITWKDPKLFSHCTACQKKFNLINRKHHCRLCAEVFCSKCTSTEVTIHPVDANDPTSRMSIEPGEIPICVSCFDQISRNQRQFEYLQIRREYLEAGVLFLECHKMKKFQLSIDERMPRCLIMIREGKQDPKSIEEQNMLAGLFKLYNNSLHRIAGYTPKSERELKIQTNMKQRYTVWINHQMKIFGQAQRGTE